VRGDSEHWQLANRLLDHLRANQKYFETAGFRWRNDPAIKSANIKVPAWLLADDAPPNQTKK
jgi:hypothetical protein